MKCKVYYSGLTCLAPNRGGYKSRTLLDIYFRQHC